MIPIRAPFIQARKNHKSRPLSRIILTWFSSGIMILITYFTLCFPRIWAWICTPFNFNLYLVSLIVRDPLKIIQNQPKIIFELFQNDFYIRYGTKPRLKRYPRCLADPFSVRSRFMRFRRLAVTDHFGAKFGIENSPGPKRSWPNQPETHSDELWFITKPNSQPKKNLNQPQTEPYKW